MILEPPPGSASAAAATASVAAASVAASVDAASAGPRVSALGSSHDSCRVFRRLGAASHQQTGCHGRT